MAELREVGFSIVTADTALVTTAETVVATSDVIQVPTATALVVVHAWAQLTTGAATTTVTPRIRRGTDTAGTLIGEANAVTIGAVAGSTEQFQAMASEQISGIGPLQYVFTLAQAAATGNGSALQAGIIVLLL